MTEHKIHLGGRVLIKDRKMDLEKSEAIRQDHVAEYAIEMERCKARQNLPNLM